MQCSLAVVTTESPVSTSPQNLRNISTSPPTITPNNHNTSTIHHNNGPKTIPVQPIPQTTSRPWPRSPPPTTTTTTTTTTTRPRTLNTTSPRHRPPNSHNCRRGCLPRNAPDSNRRRNNHPSSREDILLRRAGDHRRAVYYQREEYYRNCTTDTNTNRHTNRAGNRGKDRKRRRNPNPHLALRHNRPPRLHPRRRTPTLLGHSRQPSNNPSAREYRFPREGVCGLSCSA